MKIYAFTDLHGRFDLLEKVIDKIPPDSKVIYLGDAIDRGPNSAKVVSKLMEMQAEEGWIILKGNHEDMMYYGLRDDSTSYVWYMNGGSATIASYNNDNEHMDYDSAWMNNLPTQVDFGHFTFVHAMASNDFNERIWGRYYDRDAIDWPRHVIHGHTPHRFPEMKNNRTNLDIGAYKSGKVALAIINTNIPNCVNVITVE